MLCLKQYITFFTISLNIILTLCAPQNDGYTYPSDDDDRVISHVIDPTSNETDLFAFGSTNNDDRVISTVINMNSSDTTKLFDQFNISMEDVMRRLNKDSASTQKNLDTMSSNDNNNGQNDDDNKETTDKGQYIEIFKQKIMSSVDRQNNGSQDLTDDSSLNTLHNVAFYPVCSKNNETSWLAENTAKLYFSSTIFVKLEPNTYLHNAKLRLRQIDPDQTEQPHSTRCDEPDDIIRVTVSVLVKRNIKGGNNRTANSRRASSRREMKTKKRFCTSFTTPKKNVGWIEIDVRQVIRQWEKAYRANASNRGGQTINDPMLTIDVEDQDQIPLRAGRYFEPTDCQASSVAIPWSFYGDEDIRNNAGHSTLPHNPRIDLKYSSRHPSETSFTNYHRHNHYHHHRHQHRKNFNRFDNSNYQRLTSDSLVADEPERRNFQYVSEQQLQRQRHLQNRQQQQQHRHHVTDDLDE